MKWVYSLLIIGVGAGAFVGGRWSVERVPVAGRGEAVGRFVLVQAGERPALKLDTVTGQAWQLGDVTFRPKGLDVQVREVAWQRVHAEAAYFVRDGKQFSPGGIEVDLSPSRSETPWEKDSVAR